jgi:glycerol-3-phosphate cytidylyltransferase
MENKGIVGYAYLVADMIHIGHLRHLKRCKKKCDYLIAGILTDEATMEKKVAPIIPFEQRVEMVKALKYVDCVVKQGTYSPLNNVKKIKPDILFESTSHDLGAIDDAKKVAKKVVVMPYTSEISSTEIKNKIKKIWTIK